MLIHYLMKMGVITDSAASAHLVVKLVRSVGSCCEHDINCQVLPTEDTLFNGLHLDEASGRRVPLFHLKMGLWHEWSVIHRLILVLILGSRGLQ